MDYEKKVTQYDAKNSSVTKELQIRNCCGKISRYFITVYNEMKPRFFYNLRLSSESQYPLVPGDSVIW